MQSHGIPQHASSRNTEISEGNPRQLRQNPQEVELRQGKPLFCYRELWMSGKLVEQELHWFPLDSSSSDTQIPAGNLPYRTACQEPTQPSPPERGRPSDTSFPPRAKVPFQEGLFPSLCTLLTLRPA